MGPDCGLGRGVVEGSVARAFLLGEGAVEIGLEESTALGVADDALALADLTGVGGVSFGQRPFEVQLAPPAPALEQPQSRQSARAAEWVQI